MKPHRQKGAQGPKPLNPPNGKMATRLMLKMPGITPRKAKDPKDPKGKIIIDKRQEHVKHARSFSVVPFPEIIIDPDELSACRNFGRFFLLRKLCLIFSATGDQCGNFSRMIYSPKTASRTSPKAVHGRREKKVLRCPPYGWAQALMLPQEAYICFT